MGRATTVLWIDSPPAIGMWNFPALPQSFGQQSKVTSTFSVGGSDPEAAPVNTWGVTTVMALQVLPRAVGFTVDVKSYRGIIDKRRPLCASVTVNM